MSNGERRVVEELVKDGASNRAIALRLGIGIQTVKFHLASVAIKSGVRNRTALALWWIRVGRYQEPYDLGEEPPESGSEPGE